MHAEGYPNLKVNKKGRPSYLNDPDVFPIICMLFASGLGRERMQEELKDLGYEVRDPATITRWRRDPRVKAAVGKLIEDRAIQVSRKIDAIIEGRLSNAAEHMSMKDLIMIRKEFGGSTLGRKEISGDEFTVEAMKEIENDPDLADKLEALFANGDAE